MHINNHIHSGGGVVSLLLLVVTVFIISSTVQSQSIPDPSAASFLFGTTKSIQSLDKLTLYVDYKSKCSYACGRNATQPFSNLKDAISTIYETSGVKSATIMISPGYYAGIKNKELEISGGISITISSINPAIDDSFPDAANIPDIGLLKTMAVMNCQENGRAFTVTGQDTKLKLSGVAIHNCRHNLGGGVAVLQGATLSTMNTVFAFCKASFGGALYLSDQSTAHLTKTLFYENKGYPNPDFIYLNSSRLYFSSSHAPCQSTNVQPQLVKLNGTQCAFISDQLSAVSIVTVVDCGQTSSDECHIPPSDNSNDCMIGLINGLSASVYKYYNLGLPSKDCNNDGNCNAIQEDCFTCPHDCSCLYPNTSLVYTQRFPVGLTDIPNQMVEFSHLPPSSSIKQGHLVFYAKPLGNENRLLIESNSCHLELRVNGKKEFTVIEGPLKQYKYVLRLTNTTTTSIFQIDFKCNSLNPNSSFSLKQRINGRYSYIPSFYSINKCGDGIYNVFESDIGSKFHCPKDKSGGKDLSNANSLPQTTTCGDGACNEDNPQECPQDCYPEFTKTCRELAPPTKIDSIYRPTDEFIGALLNNQYLYALPGIDVFAHGIDTLTGKSKDTRIFHFGYCDDEPFSTVHDLYRGLVYTIPYGLSGTPAPKCTYSSTSTFYKTSSSISQEMTKESGLEVSASASGGFWGYSLSASAAYSQDESVQMASSHEQQSEGSFIVSKVQCETSKVILTESDVKLHHLFLRDLVHAKNFQSMKQVIVKYGTAYLKSSVMGGTLKMVSIVSNHYASTTTESELKQNAELSLSIHASAPIGSVDASGSGSMESSVSESSRQEFTSNSKQSTIITEGGSPGAFSPDEFGQNTFSSWAQSVDLRPVPISPQLGYISDLIPKNWKVNDIYGSMTIYDLWTITEYLYLIEQVTGQPIPTSYYHTANWTTTCYIIVPHTKNSESLRITTTPNMGVLPPILMKDGVTQTFWFFKTPDLALEDTPQNTYDIIDLVTSRVFTFNSGSKTPATSTSEIEIRMEGLYRSVGGSAYKIHITVFGTKGKSQYSESGPFPFMQTGYYAVVISPNPINNYNDIGDITGIQFAIQPRAREPNTIYWYIENFSVIRHCSNYAVPNTEMVCSHGHKYIYSSPNRNPIRLKYSPDNRHAIVHRNLSTKLQFPIVSPSMESDPPPIISMNSSEDDMLNL